MPTVIGDVINIILQFWWLWLIMIIVIVFIRIFYKPKRDAYKYKEFEVPELKDTTKKGLSKQFNLFGNKTKNGKIYRSFQEIAQISRYFNASGTFDVQYFDPKTRELVPTSLKYDEWKTDDNRTKYDLLLIEAKNKFWLWRVLNIKHIYFILKYHDKDGRVQLNYNPMTESIILDSKTELTNYADVWVNCEEGVEYINNISMIRLNERLQALLDSAPDKYVHLEMEQAKMERRIKIMTEAEKAKWKEREEAGDTTII